IKAPVVARRKEKRVCKVGDVVLEEYYGTGNYCVIAIMQLALADNRNENLPLPEVVEKYSQVIAETKELMFAKNHDYGEAWRDMRLTSLTDLILMKIYRVKQIENNEGLTVASEGVKANYQDMLNYAVFALIKLGLAAG